MYSVTYRLNTLEKARAEFNVKRSHDDALEDQSGTSTKGTKKHDKTPLNKAEAEMNAAEQALAGARFAKHQQVTPLPGRQAGKRHRVGLANDLIDGRCGQLQLP